jgi:hypothetical protein
MMTLLILGVAALIVLLVHLRAYHRGWRDGRAFEATMRRHPASAMSPGQEAFIAALEALANGEER